MKCLGLRNTMGLLKEGYTTAYNLKEGRIYIVDKEGNQVATVRKQIYFDFIIDATKRIICSNGIDYREIKC